MQRSLVTKRSRGSNEKKQPENDEVRKRESEDGKGLQQLALLLLLLLAGAGTEGRRKLSD